MDSETKKLYRSCKNRILAGVCGGLGEYFDIDPIIMRIAFVLLSLGHGLGLLIYIILAVIIPKDPSCVDQDGKAGANTQKIKEAAKDLGEQARTVVEDFKKDKNWLADGKNLLGILLIIVGFFVLVNQLFPLAWMRWNLLWPAALILVGVYLIFKNKKHGNK